MASNGLNKSRRWRFSFHKSSSSSSDKTKPLREFICPISGSLMFDPVIVPSGQTFERRSVDVCRKLNFVPVLAGGVTVDFSSVIPNLALKKAIESWCELNRADLPCSEPDCRLIENSVLKLMSCSVCSSQGDGDGDSRLRDSEMDLVKGMAEKPPVILTHAATQLNPRSVHRRFYSSSSDESIVGNVPYTPPLPLVTRPLCYSSSPSCSSDIVTDETLDPQNFSTKLQSLDVFEQQQSVISLRKLTRTDEEARISLCTPRLLTALRQCLLSKHAAVQTNAVAIVVNFSLDNNNKLKLLRSGIVPPLIDVLTTGSAESQSHAAGALFSLSLSEDNKTAIGVLGGLPPLLQALHSGTERTRHDSALALYHLSLIHTNRVKLVKLSAVSTLLPLLSTDDNHDTDLAGRVLLVLCNLASSNEGKSSLLDSNAIELLLGKLSTEKGKLGSAESTRENCVACLYSLSVGSMRFKGLARAAGAAEVLRQVAETGSERAREKAKRMLVMLRERDDGEEGRDWDGLLEGGVTRTRYRGNSTGF